MNQLHTKLLILSSILIAVPASSDAQDKKPLPPFLIANFAPLNGLPEEGKYRLAIELEASDGKKYPICGFDIDRGGAVEGSVCDAVVASLMGTGWGFTRTENRLLITSMTDAKNQRHSVTGIRITTQNIPQKHMPKIIAQKGIKVNVERK